jgi:predicted RNase H-like nuclease (RuvC/YqgF family)
MDVTKVVASIEQKDAQIAKLERLNGELNRELGEHRTRVKALERADERAKQSEGAVRHLEAELAAARNEVARLQAAASSAETERAELEAIVAGVAERDAADKKLEALVAGKAA